MAEKYDSLKLENQLCFPLYACSKEMVKRYKPFLDALNLTYTQYITMAVLWEENEISVKRLGQRLLLDSGTLTPVLKTLEKKGFVTRARSKVDERVLIVTITEVGIQLRDIAMEIPDRMWCELKFPEEDRMKLLELLHRLLKELI